LFEDSEENKAENEKAKSDLEGKEEEFQVSSIAVGGSMED